MRPIDNPPNPWLSTSIEYLDEIPPAQFVVYEDHTREIISKNDSPDLGFQHSINPYRGCQHACAYCLDGDTPIWMADGGTKPLRALHVGDLVCGTERRGHYRRYRPTRVLAHWASVKPAYRIELEDGTRLIASGDHRFLTLRGWKYVTGHEQGRARRPHLTSNDKLMGIGALQAAPAETEAYRRGYLTGMVRGDALLKKFSYERARRRSGDQFQFRLALTDLEALARTRAYLGTLDIETHAFQFQAATALRREMHAIRTHRRAHYEAIEAIVEWPERPSLEWSRGFLAGIFDAEGSHSRGILRICNTDQRIIDEVVRSLERHGFAFTVEPPRASAVATNVRLVGGLRERARFILLTDPAITRKRTPCGMALKHDAALKVRSVHPLGVDLPMFDITTETGDFVANGVVSHNCYARPTHEYLGFGAGTDFDRIITVKPDAARLLRAAFDRRSWRGDLIMFSGVTDCYQPLEASYGLTRACLEVCLEYRNPVAIITKAPLVERDVELLVALHERARCTVTLSIPFWDPAVARGLEPFVATPQRRVRTLERLARAGLPVTVNVAPLIPGLGEAGMVPLLEAAAAAGARGASLIYLRLPGSVKQVFEERVREVLPLRADAILKKVRRARGGALYDSRFGHRHRGEGPEAGAAEALFAATVRRLGLDRDADRDDRPSTFTRPPRAGEQLRLM